MPSNVMPANTIRLERLALLVILAALGILFKLIVPIRALRSSSKGLAAKGMRRVLASSRGSRPHAPPAT